MDLTLSSCFLIVHNPDDALAFYRDALGFEVRNDVDQGGLRWITVGASSQPDVNIVLTNYLDGGAATAEAVADLLSRGASNGLQFRAADLDAVFASVRDAGGDVVQEPTTQPWGARDCVFRDPSGNTVRINQGAAA